MDTKDIIKILPFEEEFKKKLLDSFDTFDEDLKFEMERIIWNTYDTMFKLKVEENMEVALDAFKDDDSAPDPEFYKKIVEKTKQQMKTDAVQTQAQVDLDSTRESLQALIAKKSE